jgi:TrpR-related protein YerC/YecD
MTGNNNSYSNELKALYRAVASLSDEEECESFFDDLCTVTELHALAQRLEVAKRLRSGQSFNLISSETGASTATISRVSRALSKGAGGYDSVLKKI